MNLAVDQHIMMNNRKLPRLCKYTTNSFLALRKFRHWKCVKALLIIFPDLPSTLYSTDNKSCVGTQWIVGNSTYLLNKKHCCVTKPVLGNWSV